MIEVKKIDDSHYEVRITNGAPSTHFVEVDANYHKKLTGGKVDRAQLVEDSFEFLLSREPNTSILRSFELSVISRYFPDYEKTMQKKYA